MKNILEGTLTLKLDDGRELSELVFGEDHARRVLECWAAGECPGRYQAASGDHHDCTGDLGHAGSCGHDAWRRDTEEVC